MKWLLRRLKDALHGQWYALLNDKSFRWQVGGILVLTIILLVFFKPLRELEVLFVGLAYTLIIVTELQNSALEEALDKLHPELDEQMKISKHLAAGAVLAAGFFLAFVLLVMVATRI